MKVAGLITARLKSTRLPGKALLPLMGRPLLSHLLERLRKVVGIDDILLCTSTLHSDDPLEEWSASHGIKVFRGHPEDVIDRLTKAAKSQNASHVLSVTGDNPLTDPSLLESLLRFHLRHGWDYSRYLGLPLGSYGYTLKVEAMERACAMKRSTATEIWGPLFDGPEFRVGNLQFAESEPWFSRLRLTCDTAEDLAFLQRIMKKLESAEQLVTFNDIVALCRKEPRLLSLNAHVPQRPAPPRESFL